MKTRGLVQNGSDIISRIAQTATGHSSLQFLELKIQADLSEESAEAIGNMLCNSPTLRVLSLRDVSIGPEALRQLLLGLQDMDSTLEKLDLSREWSDNSSDEFGSSLLGDLLGSNLNVKSLDLSCRGIGNNGCMRSSRRAQTEQQT
jgi:Ran GTPase-activating protein (RanGAP) involved in mRNA processing and transport